MHSSTCCQAGISAQILQPLAHSFCGLCGPEPPAQHDPRSRCESCSELTLIQKCFGEGSLAGDLLPCSGGGCCLDTVAKLLFCLLSVTGNCSAWGSRGWLFISSSLLQPWTAHEAPLGSSSLLPCIPIFWDKSWGGAWSPGELTLFLFCPQCSRI